MPKRVIVTNSAMSMILNLTKILNPQTNVSLLLLPVPQSQKDTRLGIRKQEPCFGTAIPASSYVTRTC